MTDQTQGWAAYEHTPYEPHTGAPHTGDDHHDDQPPARHRTRRRRNLQALLVVLLVIVTAAASSAITAIVITDDDTQPDDDTVALATADTEPAFDRANVPDAEVLDACHAEVEDRLRAPGSATYGDENVLNKHDGTYFASGYVDSQNGFGAMLRSNWTCDVRMLLSGTWADFVVVVNEA